MMSSKSKIFAKTAGAFNDRVAFYLIDICENGRVFSADKPAMIEISEGREPDPLFVFSKHEAQILMDSLWDCGLRPSEGSGSAGAMAATEKHLNDMRAIVAVKLKVTL